MFPENSKNWDLCRIRIHWSPARPLEILFSDFYKNLGSRETETLGRFYSLPFYVVDFIHLKKLILRVRLLVIMNQSELLLIFLYFYFHYFL